jgi:hypothetical protein
LIQVTLAPVNINLYLQDRRGFGDDGPGHIGQAKELGAIVDLVVNTADSGNKKIVTLVYQRKDMTTENLHRQTGVGYYPGGTGR